MTGSTHKPYCSLVAWPSIHSRWLSPFPENGARPARERPLQVPSNQTAW
jgi:hypothetical protein